MQISRSRRGRMEIIAEILVLCRRPQGKTRIMYDVNLSYNMVQKYLENMIALKFIEVHHSEDRYITTRKGIVFLQKWLSLTELLTEEQYFKNKYVLQPFQKDVLTTMQIWSHVE